MKYKYTFATQHHFQSIFSLLYIYIYIISPLRLLLKGVWDNVRGRYRPSYITYTY